MLRWWGACFHRGSGWTTFEGGWGGQKRGGSVCTVNIYSDTCWMSTDWQGWSMCVCGQCRWRGRDRQREWMLDVTPRWTDLGSSSSSCTLTSHLLALSPLELGTKSGMVESPTVESQASETEQLHKVWKRESQGRVREWDGMCDCSKVVSHEPLFFFFSFFALQMRDMQTQVIQAVCITSRLTTQGPSPVWRALPFLL